MSIKIEFTGYVREIKTGTSKTGKPWTLAKVVHNQVRKTESGEWENVGKDFFDIFLPEGVSLAEDDRFEVIGKLKTSLYDKTDGTKGISLSVNADSIRKADAFKKDAPKVESKPAEIPATWSEVSQAAPVSPEDAPF
jgi:hypothetical protein